MRLQHHRFIGKCLGALSVALGMGSVAARAELLEIDYLAPGDQLITLDKDTCLEWLDLTESEGHSVNHMLSQFGPGGDFEGWRHATQPEVQQFFAANGVVTLGSLEEQSLPIVAMLNRVGLLETINNPGDSFYRRYSNAYLDEIVSQDQWRMLSCVVVDMSGPNYTYAAAIVHCGSGHPDASNSGSGHWLVRDSQHDEDGDGVRACEDLCPGFDDSLDADADTVPDGCDLCPGVDDTLDADSDGVPDCVDVCPGHDDNLDSDGDGAADGCDACPFDAANDADGDGVCGDVDQCEGHDDTIDCNANGLPDVCEMASPSWAAAFDGGSDDPYQLNGSAEVVDNAVRLTPASNGMNGTLMANWPNGSPVAEFTASFRVRIGSGSGADGLAFAMLSRSDHGPGTLFGVSGPASGAPVVIQFDTHHNPEAGDPSNNFFGLRRNGALIATYSPTFDINDYQWRTAQVVLAGGAVTMTITPDGGSPEIVFDAVSIPGFAPTPARFGFSGGTGGLHDEHWIDDVSIAAAAYGFDCNANAIPDDCDILGETSEDCDSDGVPDECYTGPIEDCNANGTPDFCEGDCNGNGIADECDITAATSADCDGDGVPDECFTAPGLVGQYYDSMDLTSLQVTRIDSNVNFQWDLGSPHPSIGSETFSVRWTGQVRAPRTGEISFIPRTDDGVRLWVDNQLIVDQWIDQGATDHVGTISLEAGVQYPIVMEYFENGGAALAQLRWSGPGLPDAIIPAEALFHFGEDCNGNGTLDACESDSDADGIADDCDACPLDPDNDIDGDGVCGDVDNCPAVANPTQADTDGDGTADACDLCPGFDDNDDCDGDGTPDDCDTIAEIDCNGNGVDDACDLIRGTSTDCDDNGTLDDCQAFVGGLRGTYFDNLDLTNPVLTRIDGPIDFSWGANSPHPSVGPETFSVRWTGWLEAFTTDTILIKTTSDDGVRVWFDGQLIIDRWFDQAATEWAVSVPNVVQGVKYPIVIEYYENGGGAMMRLEWATSITPWEVIPALSMSTFQDCNGNGSFDTCDIQSGTSLDCQLNGIPDECEVAAGQAEDCNANGIPDLCDIAGAVSSDCDGNGEPDECQASEDCNGNSANDVCDVISGTSDDCNDNLVPDECDLVSGGGLDLDATIAQLNLNHPTVTALVPTRYDFSDGAVGNSIGDGGGDMYDGGNYLHTNLAGQIAYTNGVITASDGQFGPGSSYFTAKYPGMFVMAATNMTISHFSIQGNTGADGGGSVNGTTLQTVVAGRQYTIFVKRVFNAGDPSINHLLIVSGDGAGITHTWSANTDNDQDALDGLAGVRQLAYVLVARQVGGYLDDADVLNVANAFLTLAQFQHGDCNGNGIPDDCDVTAGTSLDCDGNATPDECQLVDNDCNGNLIPDQCDAVGYDCDLNHVPDECQLADNDCNGNLVPDHCDAVDNDCDANAIPDDCELIGNDCDNNGVHDACELADNDCNDNGIPDACDLLAGTEADVLPVGGDGVPDACQTVHNLTQDTWHVGIQAAITAAVNGDELLAVAAVYPESFSFLGKAVHLRGSAGAAGTTIDLTGVDGYGVAFETGEGVGTILEGFTIRGARANAAVFMSSSSPTVKDCLFTDNQACFPAIHGYGASPTVTGTVFLDNIDIGCGGTAYLQGGSPTFTDCVFRGNQACGGALLLDGAATTLVNCELVENDDIWGCGGGAIYAYNSPLSISHSTLSGNHSSNVGGSIYTCASTLTMTNSISWGNSAAWASNEIHHDCGDSSNITFSNVAGGPFTMGNIDADPLFVNAAAGDYRLRQGSPCIDTGDTAAVPPGLVTDLAGNDRVYGAGVDMGAYEWDGTVTGACCTGVACHDGVELGACEPFVCDVRQHHGSGFNGCYGDADGNGVVNAADRGAVSANIGQADAALVCVFDLDGNGVVNAADRGAVSANIGLCQPLPDFQNGSGLNGGNADTRFGSAQHMGGGTTCDEVICP